MSEIPEAMAAARDQYVAVHAAAKTSQLYSSESGYASILDVRAHLAPDI